MQILKAIQNHTNRSPYIYIYKAIAAQNNIILFSKFLSLSLSLSVKFPWKLQGFVILQVIFHWKLTISLDFPPESRLSFFPPPFGKWMTRFCLGFLIFYFLMISFVWGFWFCFFCFFFYKISFVWGYWILVTNSLIDFVWGYWY